MELNTNASYNQLFFMKMKMGNIPIIPQNINYVVIREWMVSMMPTVQISLNDDGMLSEIFHLQDEMPIEIQIGKTPNDENPITVDFMVVDYSMGQSVNNNYGIFEITGVLNIPQLFSPIKTRSFKNKSSKTVLNSIASLDGFTMSTANNVNPNDNMTWLQANQTDLDFMQHVLDRAYVRNDSVLGYFSTDKKFYLTTLNNIINGKIKKIARYDVTKFNQLSFDNEEDKNTIWFNYYDMLNMNGFYNKINNYGIDYVYHDISNSKSKSLNFKTSQLADKTFKNKNRVNNTVKKHVFGAQFNTHNNYHAAQVENRARLMNLLGFSMVINVNSLTDVKLAELISVNIPHMASYATEGPNLQLSGKYVVVGQTYTVSKNNIFRKQLIVARDGINDSGYDSSFEEINA